jgi:hypothetical protein
MNREATNFEAISSPHAFRHNLHSSKHLPRKSANYSPAPQVFFENGEQFTFLRISPKAQSSPGQALVQSACELWARFSHHAARKPGE